VSGTAPPATSTLTNQISSSSQFMNTVTMTPNDGMKKNNVGALVGGIIGGLAFIASVSVGTFYIKRRLRNYVNDAEGVNRSSQSPEIFNDGSDKSSFDTNTMRAQSGSVGVMAPLLTGERIPMKPMPSKLPVSKVS
jgi:hypothetical protein